MDTFTASEARAALPEILDRVEAGEELAITRHGRSVAVVVSPESLRERRIEALVPGIRRVRKLLEAGRASDGLRQGLSPEYAEALVAEIRTGRADR